MKTTGSVESSDVLIVGLGISGLVMALSLTRHNRSFRIIHKEKVGSASRAAAGLFNPVTGRRPTLTWNAQKCFSFLHDFYPYAEQILQTTFFYPKFVFRPALSNDTLNDYQALSAAEPMSSFVEVVEDVSLSSIHPQLAYGLITKNSGFLHVSHFLDRGAAHFASSGNLQTTDFDYRALKLHKQGVEYEDRLYRWVIFCEGSRVLENPWFESLPFSLYHGEVLDVFIPDFPELYCINKGVFVLPVGNQLFKVGATYARGNTYGRARPEGIEELLNGLKALGVKHFELKSCHWGVRPATKDRKPMVGAHPSHSSLVLFNGMGSKAVSLAPFLANQLIGHLFEGIPLLEEVNIRRFKSYLDK
jgi:glycine/D-amino acid oxidase-like deaminating enzyme